jgi:class 3 adenylate cyclase/alpha-beta hydrolase superfamily lysophospholipase
VRPQTQYARSGDVYIGYQVFGEGPFDLVVVPGALSNIEYGWELQSWAEFYGAFASFARVILFDKRGTGISDPVVGAPSLEERMDDVRAVMDAVGSERAALMGASDGAAMVALFAATYPERAAALVLNNPMVRGAWSPDYPWGAREEEARSALPDMSYTELDRVKTMIAGWAPSRVGDEAFARWTASYTRLSASPTTLANLVQMNLRIDVREALATIRAPTLVAHRELPGGDRSHDPLLPNDADASRYVAARISGARFIQLVPGDIAPWAGDIGDTVTSVRDFLTSAWEAGAWAPAEPDRVLATVLFTDIVGSTARASELGDARWRELIQHHHALVRQHLVRFRGRELDTAGDGFFASFDGPARAVRCACAISGGVRDLGIEVRAGLHTGECELIEGKMSGIAVHIGARVASLAAPGEVLVSRTVKDLVAGSGLEFEERGTRELNGIPGEWRLFAVRR